MAALSLETCEVAEAGLLPAVLVLGLSLIRSSWLGAVGAIAGWFVVVMIMG